MKSVSARLARAVNRVFGREGPVLFGRYGIALLVAGSGWLGGTYLVLALLSTYGFAVQKDLSRALATGIDPDTGGPFDLD